ncbi:MAG: hypothetical protein NTX56_20615, partial [Proteobacteria bacterium]|nr:hypothetical protein [Pseudomonadota bacterium]
MEINAFEQGMKAGLAKAAAGKTDRVPSGRGAAKPNKWTDNCGHCGLPGHNPDSCFLNPALKTWRNAAGEAKFGPNAAGLARPWWYRVSKNKIKQIKTLNEKKITINSINSRLIDTAANINVISNPGHLEDVTARRSEAEGVGATVTAELAGQLRINTYTDDAIVLDVSRDLIAIGRWLEKYPELVMVCNTSVAGEARVMHVYDNITGAVLVKAELQNGLFVEVERGIQSNIHLSSLTETDRNELARDVETVKQHAAILKAQHQQLNTAPSALHYSANALNNRLTWAEFHENAGHPFDKTMHFMIDNNLIQGLTVGPRPADFHCLCDSIANIRKRRHASEADPSTHSQKTGEIIHMDFEGPVNGLFSLVLLDDFSEYVWSKVMDAKHLASDTIIEFFTWFEKHINPIKFYRCDNAKDFWNEKVISFCTARGIEPMPIGIYSAQEAGRIEKRNELVLSIIRPILVSAGMYDEELECAFTQATALLNLRPCAKNHTTTPHYKLYNEKPTTSILHPFGGKVIVKHYGKQSKVAPKGKIGRFMGMAGRSDNTCKIQVETIVKNGEIRKRIINSGDVKFFTRAKNAEATNITSTPFHDEEIEQVDELGQEIYDGEHENKCHECNQGGTLLMCDGCEHVFHFK